MADQSVDSLSFRFEEQKLSARTALASFGWSRRSAGVLDGPPASLLGSTSRARDTEATWLLKQHGFVLGAGIVASTGGVDRLGVVYQYESGGAVVYFQQELVREQFMQSSL